MGLLSTLLMALSSGGGAIYEFIKTHNIFGIGNVCSSVPFEKLVVQLTSLATLSITEMRFTVSPSAVIGILNYLGSLYLFTSPSSVPNVCTNASGMYASTPSSAYSLATAVT